MFDEHTEPPVALITGGSRGIGAATVLELVREGWKVAFTYLERKDKADEIAKAARELGGQAIAHQLDVADVKDVGQVVDRVVNELGSLHGVVANAGLYERADSKGLRAEPALWQRAMDVNLTGVWNLLSACNQQMHGAGANETVASSMVVVSSIKAHVGNPQGAHYAAAKAGSEGLVRSLALEWAPKVRVNGVVPGFIDTDLIAGDTKTKREARNRTVPLGRVGRPEEVARTIAFLLSQRSSYITGQMLHVNGGLYLG